MADEAGRDDGVDHSRRAFIKKGLVAGFVAPVVVSFALDDVAEARQRHPNQTFNNQGGNFSFIFERIFRALRRLRFFF